MSYCPNKSSQEWKDLVSKVGENKAYLEWFLGSIREQKSDLEKDEDVQFKKTTDPKLMKILRQYNYDQSGFFKYQVNKFQLETILKNAGYDFQVMKSQYGSPYLASNGKFLKVSFNRSESEASDEISEAAASTLVKALSDKLGIKYNFVTKAQARDLLEAEGKVYNDESAFYYRGQTYFTEFNLDDSIHEFSHPLFDALESVNPRLLWTLISSILETDEGKAINKEVASLYKEDFIDGVPSIRALKEIGVRALTAAAKKNINPETGKPFLAAIKRLFLAFKQALRDMFGKDIKISELNENTTLQELADMLTIGKGKLDLTSLNIKPGVEELFESNPELANAVYETLGFNQMITPNDKVVFGHPTIGKSFLKNQGEDKFISLDDDYATEINSKVKEIADKYNVTTYQVKDGGTQKWNNEYNQMMQKMFNVAKQGAISENKTLFTSNTNLLRNNAESFDKVINLTDKEFERRIQERGAKYDIKEWKSQINDAISKLPTNKVINTDKYLSDLFITPQQKQQAQQLYSQYLDTIFPDSQVKDISYHTNTQGRIEFGTRGEKGLFVTPTWELAKTYKPGPYGKRFQLLINSSNVLELSELELMKGLKRGNEDTQKYSEEDYTEYVVFEPEQIHILGSKQDIEGFKKFTKNNKQETEDVQF
jgi:hypothetical protein